VSRSQKDWDEYFPHLLFAYHEVPQETISFSPFDLLYGHYVRGPLKEGWGSCNPCKYLCGRDEATVGRHGTIGS